MMKQTLVSIALVSFGLVALATPAHAVAECQGFRAIGDVYGGGDVCVRTSPAGAESDGLICSTFVDNDCVRWDTAPTRVCYYDSANPGSPVCVPA